MELVTFPENPEQNDQKSENLKNVVFHRPFWFRIFRVGNIEPMVYFILIFGFYHVSPWQETAMRETVRFPLWRHCVIMRVWGQDKLVKFRRGHTHAKGALETGSEA
uniref:Uncharacterized protein n=1 Tax=Candidatus Kentrum sp. LPFa TaxID=2126335 RepID=A0A450WUH2_9GAMM|nr:MAG: hypothetical protein BECKLPF1236A_GA0070988_102703 [Candidatus Kentron sp. LPFa]VFK34525.1 MAG: hypothetical protein BECKLPF1236C_GA0070990_102774 [Candidatus Kentron sp. LPFa]